MTYTTSPINDDEGKDMPITAYDLRRVENTLQREINNLSREIQLLRLDVERLRTLIK